MKRAAFFIGCLLLGWSGLAAAAASTEGKDGLLSLGEAAPDFSLPDVVTGKTVSLSDFKDKKAMLVMIVCRHCPYVQHIKAAVGGNDSLILRAQAG